MSSLNVLNISKHTRCFRLKYLQPNINIRLSWYLFLKTTFNDKSWCSHIAFPLKKLLLTRVENCREIGCHVNVEMGVSFIERAQNFLNQLRKSRWSCFLCENEVFQHLELTIQVYLLVYWSGWLYVDVSWKKVLYRHTEMINSMINI